MFRIVVAATLAMGVALMAAGCSGARPAPPASPSPSPSAPIAAGTSTGSLRSGGATRTYRVHVPADLPSAPALVLMLHGGFGTGKQAEKSYGWDAEADEKGFVVAYPDGLHRSWNAGGNCCGSAVTDDVDDVGYLEDLVRDLEQRLHVDAAKVYVTGFSNGAIMAYRLACESDVFAAVAPVSGTRLVACGSPSPTSVFAVNGTADEHVRYDGAPATAGVAHIDGPPIPDLIADWQDTDHCAAATDAAHSAVTVATAICADGRSVALATVHGYGHEWPTSGADSGGTPLADDTYTGWDATAAIWAFFEAHPKR